jgi:hypothetical protein
MNAKIVIYDPPMCCPSGLCGPNPDPRLIDLQNTIFQVKQLGAEVERYIITQAPDKFRENPDVIKLIQAGELKALPITTLNERVIKSGSYPTLVELKNLLGKA